jgi:hypothetical protein
MSQLPEFRKCRYDQVHGFASRAFYNARQSSSSRLVQLITYDDNHYRAIFRKDYFALPEGQTEPTRSQWNTLKRHMKRMDADLFVFKQHGEVPCGKSVSEAGTTCYYVDFGFFKYSN